MRRPQAGPSRAARGRNVFVGGKDWPSCARDLVSDRLLVSLARGRRGMAPAQRPRARSPAPRTGKSVCVRQQDGPLVTNMKDRADGRTGCWSILSGGKDRTV